MVNASELHLTIEERVDSLARYLQENTLPNIRHIIQHTTKLLATKMRRTNLERREFEIFWKQHIVEHNGRLDALGIALMCCKYGVNAMVAHSCKTFIVPGKEHDLSDRHTKERMFALPISILRKPGGLHAIIGGMMIQTIKPGREELRRNGI